MDKNERPLDVDVYDDGTDSRADTIVADDEEQFADEKPIDSTGPKSNESREPKIAESRKVTAASTVSTSSHSSPRHKAKVSRCEL